MPKVSKTTYNLFCKNVENHAIFVEGFGPEFYARGRFMKYSMSVLRWTLQNPPSKSIVSLVQPWMALVCKAYFCSYHLPEGPGHPWHLVVGSLRSTPSSCSPNGASSCSCWTVSHSIIVGRALRGDDKIGGVLAGFALLWAIVRQWWFLLLGGRLHSLCLLLFLLAPHSLDHLLRK